MPLSPFLWTSSSIPRVKRNDFLHSTLNSSHFDWNLQKQFAEACRKAVPESEGEGKRGVNRSTSKEEEVSKGGQEGQEATKEATKKAITRPGSQQQIKI